MAEVRTWQDEDDREETKNTATQKIGKIGVNGPQDRKVALNGD